MEQGSTAQAFDEVGFAKDLAELGAQALRVKYKREASSHAAMKRRCRNGSFALDPEWNDFRSFLRDMGPRPTEDATLDRLDPSIFRYGPGLCRWATKTEQTINRRNTVWVEFQGERIRLQEFAAMWGAPYSTIHTKLAKGETPEAIARSYAAGAAPGPTFSPQWIEEDAALKQWRAQYERWLRRVRRDRRSAAQPEVYAVIQASAALAAARRKLDKIGFYEMRDAEADDTLRRYPNAVRISANAIDWIRHALTALAERDRRLAVRLLPTHGQWEDLRKFEQWLIPPKQDP